MTDSAQFAAAIAKIDEANSADPNRENHKGQELPKEVLYSRRMSDWLFRLAPDASEALRLAAHGQHICRWTIARADYLMNRAGYHRWRKACQHMHAEKLGEILREVGYDEETTARVQSLVRKDRMKTDTESQLLEDVVCLVFLENYFVQFAWEHDEDMLVDVLRKTWKKMSVRGHAAALTLALPADARSIVERAIASN